LGVLFVEGLPERWSLSTDSRPSLKWLYHKFICASLIESSPKTFLIIGIVSTDEYPSLKQNLMQICWYACLVIVNHTVAQYTSYVNGVPLTTD
jgi:hypothetical protein